jgi:hypothetical protein
MKRQRNLRFDAILRFLNRSRREIDKCEQAEAYLAGCVLLGATVEFALTGLMRAYPRHVYRRGRKLRESWTFKSLNEFALDCGWLDLEAFLAAERIRVARNLIHPNWFASPRPPRITRHLFRARSTDFDAVWEYLSGWAA